MLKPLLGESLVGDSALFFDFGSTAPFLGVTPFVLAFFVASSLPSRSWVVSLEDRFCDESDCFSSGYGFVEIFCGLLWVADPKGCGI